MTKNPAYRHLQARLFLHAVFPTLDGVIKASPKARELLADNPFSVCFKTRSGLRASYHLSVDGCDYVPGDTSQAGIGLFFLNDAHAAATFLEKPALPPIPTRGFSALKQMDMFSALGKEMQLWLKPDAERLADADFRRTFATLSLGLALRGLIQLCQVERRGRQELLAGPNGVVTFQIGEDGEIIWLRFERDELDSGEGDPPKSPRVQVIFRDSEVAAKAVTNELDSLAAVGRGEIMVRGLAPLADHVNAIMERVAPFIDPEAAA